MSIVGLIAFSLIRGRDGSDTRVHGDSSRRVCDDTIVNRNAYLLGSMEPLTSFVSLPQRSSDAQSPLRYIGSAPSESPHDDRRTIASLMLNDFG